MGIFAMELRLADCRLLNFENQQSEIFIHDYRET